MFLSLFIALILLFACQSELKVEIDTTDVDEKFANTGLLSPSYKDLLQAGYATGSSTSFDNEADIPAQLKTAVQIAEISLIVW